MAAAVVPRTLAATNETLPRRAGADAGWTFSRGDFPGAEQQGFDDSRWRKLDIPYDWSIEGPYDENAPCGGSGGYLPTGIGWYRKKIALANSIEGKRVRLEFDGVYQRSKVWVNGHLLGERPYGYITFGYDLTPFLVPGGENLVAVRVDNSLQPNSRWYSGSGIYRHVWMITTDPVHIAPAGICVRTSEVSERSAMVEVTTRVLNETAKTVSCRVEATIRDQRGTAIGTVFVRGRVPANNHRLFVQRVPVSNPSLWCTETPALYTASSTLRAQDGSVDSESTTFGIHDIRFDADQGFLLNAKRVKLNGVCLHHDGGSVGAAVPLGIWERRFELLKEMGCNAIRCSHNPPAPEFLDLCDRRGFLVMAEAYDEWRYGKAQTPQYGYHRYFDEWGLRDAADMIDRDRNHPCIVIWSAGNEVPDQTAPDGPQTLQKLLNLFHAKDPTRLVTVACDNIAAEPKATPEAFLKKLDVVGYNYVDRWRDRREKYYSIDRHSHPHRKFIGTESPAMGGVRGAYGSEALPVFGEPVGNMRIELEQLEKFIQVYDYVSGDFMWTGIDYLGESRWPNKLAISGVIDTCGFPKDGYYFYQSLWTKKPVLHIFPHWNWRGHEGEVMSVMCYTNCDKVELFLNGKSYGTKGLEFPREGMEGHWPNYPARARVLQTTADLHLAWDVPYEPGTLKAVGAIGGRTGPIIEVTTTGAPMAIRLTCDRDGISRGWDNVALVKAEIIDASGMIVPTAEHEITFAVDGVGKISGVDSGRPDSHESYQSNVRKAFRGLALVLLQSNGSSGIMTLTAAAQGLSPADLTVLVT
ncbi:MAG: glycoside hydrolase family 2 protein [Alphaproteobacteria bacterium]|nr:glycoside hydrolase family 2 protein [Alphaproteobacteria bacterium]